MNLHAIRPIHIPPDIEPIARQWWHANVRPRYALPIIYDTTTDRLFYRIHDDTPLQELQKHQRASWFQDATRNERAGRLVPFDPAMLVLVG